LVEWNEEVSKLSKKHAEEALNELVAQKWINESRDAKVTLGVRSFAELQDWIHKLTDEDDTTMQCICEEVVVQGSRCSNEKCNKKLHFHCVQNIASTARNGIVLCPFCQQAGTYEIPENEGRAARRAVPTRTEGNEGTSGSPVATTGRRKRARGA